MPARTEQKARLLDLTTNVLELTRDGARDIENVCKALQIIKDECDFATLMFRKMVPSKIWSVAAGITVGVVSVAELGFGNGAVRERVYNRAEKFGLALCQKEVGSQLRSQYKDQPAGEQLLIAMKTEVLHERPGVFCLENRDGDLSLNHIFSSSDIILSANTLLVFRIAC